MTSCPEPSVLAQTRLVQEEMDMFLDRRHAACCEPVVDREVLCTPRERLHGVNSRTA